jgi:hypothetical protein
VSDSRELPTVQRLCLEIPLYEAIKFDPTKDELEPFRVGWRATFDAYCIACGESSVFHTINQPFPIDDPGKNQQFALRKTCSRNSDHELFFLFDLRDLKLRKIGQFPSMADLSEAELQGYRKALPEESYRELARATGLISHGIGIGAFIYLRRIFERLIEEARTEAKSDSTWNDEAFERARMGERIATLAGRLPAFLVENRSIYGILSKGVHELTEQECLEAFPVVRVSIELILDEKLEEAARAAKIDRARKEIAALSQRLRARE